MYKITNDVHYDLTIIINSVIDRQVLIVEANPNDQYYKNRLARIRRILEDIQNAEYYDD